MKSTQTLLTCWSCGAASEGGHFCTTCGKIQPLERDETDYFQILDCVPTMSPSGPALRRRYYELSRQLHPDAFQAFSEQEQAYSLERTDALNRAYRTLRTPLDRVRYILEREGFRNDDPDNKPSPPADLLMEVLQMQESVEQMHQIDDPKERANAKRKAQRIEAELKERRARTLGEIEVLASTWDNKPNQRATTAAQILCLLDVRNYVDRALKTIKDALG